MRIGVSFTLAGESLPRAETARIYVRAFLSPAWSRPLTYLLMQIQGGTGFPRKRGRIRLQERAAALTELLVHPDVWQVSLSTHGKPPYGELAIETRERRWPRYLACEGQQSLDADMPTRGDAWVTAMLELAESIRVRHGIVTVMSDSGTSSEISFVEISKEGVNQHPFPDQFERMSEPAILRELGMRYVRFPRWGTIYSKAHVEQLGGAERIRDVVRPALVRELGADAFYFQLTDSVATATAAEAMQKQHAFTELAAPLLPPERG